MILENETKTKFGYSVNSLSSGSNKLVVVQCDYCGTKYERVNKQVNKEHEKINKDACGGDCKNAKRKEICLATYGVDNVAKIPEAREKIRQSALDPELTQIKREKCKATCQEKWGVDSYLQTEEHKQRMIGNTYGSPPPKQTEETKAKIRKTCQERFGADNYFASEQGKQAKLEWCRKTYGVDNPFQAEEIKDKIKQTNIDSYGVDHHFKVQEKAKENGQKVLESKIKAGTVRTYNGKTLAELAKENGWSKSGFFVVVKEIGLEDALNMKPRESALEVFLEQNILNKLNCPYEKQFKIENKYADFVIPEHKLIIEANGNYWHSEIHKEKNYHVDKRQLYIKHGFCPLFFTDEEIYNKTAIVQSIISNKVRQTKKEYGRNCTISMDQTDGATFMSANHLMGNGKGTYFSLLDKSSNRVACMQVKLIKNEEYEISRFCNVLNMGVTGGFSKLVKFVISELKCTHLHTFIDLRYGSGTYLESLGFVKSSKCYPSFRWTNGNESFHRMTFPGSSGYDSGFFKIWDCGQQRYIKCS